MDRLGSRSTGERLPPPFSPLQRFTSTRSRASTSTLLLPPPDVRSGKSEEAALEMRYFLERERLPSPLSPEKEVEGREDRKLVDGAR